MSIANIQTQVKSDDRALRFRFSLLWQHLAIKVLLGVLVLTILFAVTRWQAIFAALIVVGFFGQMLTEYLIHRFIFHLKPPQNQFYFNVLYLAHYGHHDFPNNGRMLFVPIWFVLPVMTGGVVLYGLNFALLGFANAFDMAVVTVFIGHVIAFLGYEWYHMTAHLNIRKFGVEKRVTRLHILHHFKDYTQSYHVSFGGEMIDQVMRTAIDVENRANHAKKEFIRTIGLDPADPRLVAARRTFADEFGLSEVEIKAAERGSKLGISNQ